MSPKQEWLGSFPVKKKTLNHKKKSTTSVTEYSQANLQLAKKTEFKPQIQALIRVNVPYMDSIIIKFDQDVSTIESSSLISISDRDQKLMKMKYQTNILGNKFVELSREKIIENHYTDTSSSKDRNSMCLYNS